MAEPIPAAAPVTCPGCHAVLQGAVDQCSHCGYSAWTCVDHFPYSPPPLDRYIDVESRLSNEDRARLDREIDRIESGMPQVRLYLCVVKLLPGTDVRECGFWMLNASVPRDEEEASHRPWSVLLILDTQSLSASATVGYGLDPWLGDPQLRTALAAGRGEWVRGNLAAGAAKFLQQLHHALRAAHGAAVASSRAKGSPAAAVPAGSRPETPAKAARHHPEL